MRNLSEEEVNSVAGGNRYSIGTAVKVLWDAVNGDPPGPSALTGTADGPTPGNVGGRYPVDALGEEPSRNNIPGGQIGRTISNPIIDATRDFS